eukprot:1146840-Pelagomonas_calceolata.AAC.4
MLAQCAINKLRSNHHSRLQKKSNAQSGTALAYVALSHLCVLSHQQHCTGVALHWHMWQCFPCVFVAGTPLRCRRRAKAPQHCNSSNTHPETAQAKQQTSRLTAPFSGRWRRQAQQHRLAAPFPGRWRCRQGSEYPPHPPCLFSPFLLGRLLHVTLLGDTAAHNLGLRGDSELRGDLKLRGKLALKIVPCREQRGAPALPATHIVTAEGLKANGHLPHAALLPGALHKLDALQARDGKRAAAVQTSTSGRQWAVPSPAVLIHVAPGTAIQSLFWKFQDLTINGRSFWWPAENLTEGTREEKKQGVKKVFLLKQHGAAAFAYFCFWDDPAKPSMLLLHSSAPSHAGVLASHMLRDGSPLASTLTCSHTESSRMA